MAVKETDKFAVMLSYAKGSIDLGFESLGKAITLVEGQIEETDPAKMVEYVKAAIEEEVTVDGVTYNIVDANTYFDVYSEVADDES